MQKQTTWKFCLYLGFKMLLKSRIEPSMVAHTYNPNTGEAEVGGLLLSTGQSELHNEFQDSLSYFMRK